MTAAQAIGAALRAARGKRSRADVAKAAPVAIETLRRIEAGRGIPTERSLAAVIGALGAWDLPELMTLAAATVPRHERYANLEAGTRQWVARDWSETLSEVAVLVRAMRVPQ